MSIITWMVCISVFGIVGVITMSILALYWHRKWKKETHKLKRIQKIRMMLSEE